MFDQGADPKLGAERYPSGAMADSVSDLDQSLNIAVNGTVDVLSLLLERGICRGHGHQLPFAASSSRAPDVQGIRIMKRLLELGVDINSVDDTNYGAQMSDTPLHYAV